MTKKPIDHSTYIIRVWKEPVEPAGTEQWRFVLIAADSQQREGFVAMEHLLAALQTKLTGLTQELQP